MDSDVNKVIFFDQDGTLLDSAPGIKATANLTLKEMGLPEIPTEKLDFFIGPPLRDCFRLSHVPEERVEEACQIYRQYYNTPEGKYDAYLYPGILSLLQKLKEEGYRLFVATSKADFLAKDIATHFGLFTYFEDMFGSTLDGKRAKKKDILRYAMETLNVDSGIMVGDTYLDMDGAVENDLIGIGVSWGYGDKAMMKEHGAKQIVTSAEELLDTIYSLSK